MKNTLTTLFHATVVRDVYGYRIAAHRRGAARMLHPGAAGDESGPTGGVAV